LLLQVACKASVSVGFSVRHFLLFGGTKIGMSATLMEGAGRVRGGEKGNVCLQTP